MAKNLMQEVAKLLGVELGEVFEVTNGKHTSKAIITNNTFCEVTKEGLCNPNSLLLQVVLKGEFSVQKLPWEPKKGKRYYFPIVDAALKGEMVVGDYDWDFETFDLAMKALGMVYRTKEEAEAHFTSDYEKLTGKKLEG